MPPDFDPQANLRYLLNEWDFLGVADVVSDEYDCMIAPLLTRLSGGGTRASIAEYLYYELGDHFGLSYPDRFGTDAMADKLVAWWAAVARTLPPQSGRSRDKPVSNS